MDENDDEEQRDGLRVLFVCTANRCRSPFAEHLLRRLAVRDGVGMSATSAGLLAPGYPALPEMVEAALAYGVDLSTHRSRQLSAALIADADVIVGHERHHVREVALAGSATGALTRAFTLRDLVRRAESSPRPAGAALGDWLGALAAERPQRDLLGRSRADDIADPAGGPPAAYAATTEEIAELVARLRRVLVTD